MDIWKPTLFLCWMILCMDTCLSQRDCAGVDCPPLHNCIEMVSEKGSCCPTCVQRGCTCEGYQYYDCVQEGFRKGKVPEGESYFVDFGSTECSCPQGGGNITCHFIPCPEIPPNCIDVAQPQDGCRQCGRVGCIHGNKKYEAGHSFQIDPCQVCHCPNEGGSLMCSPIPGCDPHSVNKPMLITTPEDNNNPSGDNSSPHDRRQTSPLEPLSKLALGNTLPLYKEDPPSFGTEDYDYTLAEPTSSTPQDLALPLESTTVPPTHSESSSISFSSLDGRKRELRVKQRSPDREKSSKAEVKHHTDPTTTGAQEETTTLLTTTTAQRVTTEDHRPGPEVVEKTIRYNGGRDSSKDAARANKGDVRHSGHHKQRQTGSHGRSHASGHKGQEKVPADHEQPDGEEEHGSFPTIQFSPTSRAPVRVREDGEQPRRQPQTLHDYQPRHAEEDTGMFAFYKTFETILIFYDLQML